MLKNIGSHWVLLVVTVLATFFLIPFNLSHLGEHGYGLWLIIAALNGYLSLLNLGVPMASLRYMAQALAKNNRAELDEIVSACFGMYLAIGVLTVALAVGMLVFFEHSYRIEPEREQEMRWSFMLATAHVVVSFFLLIPQTILSAHQDFVRMNIWRIAAYLVRIALNIVLVTWYPSVLMVALSILIGTLFELFALTVLVHVGHPGVRLLPGRFSTAMVSRITGFSVFVFALALGGQIMASIGPVVIGYTLGPELVPMFAIPNSLLLYLGEFIVSISYVIMPIATTLYVEGRLDELREQLYKWTKISFALIACAAVYLIVFGPAFLNFWVGPAYAEAGASILLILMLGNLFFLPIRGVAIPILMGIGKPLRPTISFLATSIAVAVLSFALIRPLGLDGIAWAIAVPVSVLAAALAVFACRELQVSIRGFVLATFPLALLGLALATAAMWTWNELTAPAGLVGLGLAGILTMAVCALIWHTIVFRADPHIKIPPLRQLLAMVHIRRV